MKCGNCRYFLKCIAYLRKFVHNIKPPTTETLYKGIKLKWIKLVYTRIINV